MSEMLQVLEVYVKLAVDVRRGILAGGGALHADCEAVLLNDGSLQGDIWGADWIPLTKEVRFEALINIQPRRKNPSMTILNPTVQKQVADISRRLLE